MWSLMPWKQNGNSQMEALTTEPFEREFSRIRNDFDQLLRSMWNGRDAQLSQFCSGNSFDETDTHYTLAIEAPGFETGDFEVHTSGDRLTVKAERKVSAEDQHVRRYSFGSLQRTVRLPAGAAKDGIEAQYRSGVLELRIPKDPQAQNVKRIAVKSS